MESLLFLEDIEVPFPTGKSSKEKTFQLPAILTPVTEAIQAGHINMIKWFAGRSYVKREADLMGTLSPVVRSLLNLW